MQVRNHFKAEAEESFIVMMMGGSFCNSVRCDLPTRQLRIYFSPFDDYALRDGLSDDVGHVVNLVGYNESTRERKAMYPDRSTCRFFNGFQMRDLDYFVWRDKMRGFHFEVRARRVNDYRWSVEYISDCRSNAQYPNEMVEYQRLLESWFQMIDPETFEIIKLTAIRSVANIAGSATSNIDERLEIRGFHPQVFRKIKAFANDQGIEVVNRYAYEGQPTQAEQSEWWQMMLDLPREEDQPTFHEEDNALHKWKLRHADILFARYGDCLPSFFHDSSSHATEQEITNELVIIGEVIYSMLRKPPEFSFRQYMSYINWIDYSQNIEDKVLAEASKRLGWEMM